MALFEKSALKDGVAVREVWGWALFDAANSGYSTVVLTAVNRSQAVQIRNYIHGTMPTAFFVISNSSEIVGRGFLSE